MLFQELHNAKEERDHLDYCVIPTIISELEHLKLTKKEIKEIEENGLYCWD